MDWTEKYRPSSLSEVTGNNKAVKELQKWAREWEDGVPSDRAVILYGPPGIGKTSAAYALAEDMAWEVIELNASDQRAARVIERVAGSAAQMGTFSGVEGRRLVVLDEADNIHGTADRGGEQAMIRVIKDARQPMILIANDYYDMSHGLRNQCEDIQFKGLQKRSVAKVLRQICKAENIEIDPAVIDRIAGDSGGDMRGAINDLQAIATGRDQVEESDLVVASRDTKESIFNVLKTVFKNRDLGVARQTYDLDMSPEDLVHWVDENLPREYEDGDLAAGYEKLSRADVFLGRVKRRQTYGLWRYASFLMTAGVQTSRDREYRGWTPYKRPDVWNRLWRTKQTRRTRDNLARKVGGHCHTSTADARTELIPFLKLLFRDRERGIGISALLDLDESEIAFLLETRKNAKKVSQIYERAQEIREIEIEEEIEAFGGFTTQGRPKKTKEKQSPDPKTKENEDEEEEDKTQKSLFEF